MPLSRWPSFSTQTTSEPWASFERTRHFVESGDTQSATATLQGILNIPGLESRHYLQAYHFLAELDVAPIHGLSKNVIVVVEVGMKDGTDLVAGYADHHARYYNYSGAGVVWERSNGTLGATIDELLRAGATVAQVIGPWKKKRPPAPSNGRARLSLLTPSGLHFGEGPLAGRWAVCRSHALDQAIFFSLPVGCFAFPHLSRANAKPTFPQLNLHNTRVRRNPERLPSRQSIFSLVAWRQ